MHVHKVWLLNDTEMKRIKLIMALHILLTASLDGLAQQPCLPQVKEYLERTGNVVSAQAQIEEKKYCLLQQDYKEQSQLMLDVPVFRSKGMRAIMPLGFKLSNLSEIPMESSTDNISLSKRISLYNSHYFKEISYQFCDSTVYGIIFYINPASGKEIADIEEELVNRFSKADCIKNDISIYSDEDFAVRFDKSKYTVEVYSLFHYPIVESFYSGVSHKVYYGPFEFIYSDNESVMLAFFNQESKENNIQTAFKVWYQGKFPMRFNSICFKVNGQDNYEFKLESELTGQTNSGVTERDTRTFIMPDILQSLQRAHQIEITIKGENGSLFYKMPWFQRISLNTAYEYFRWHVTNPMAKYRAW